MKSEKLFSHASPVWPVKDIYQSLDYYKNQLGFKVKFTWEDPITYAVIKRDGISIHLTTDDDATKNDIPKTALFIFVHDVDKVYDEFLKKDIKIIAPIGNRDYGMRDFDIEDIDGYRLIFGKNVEK